MSSPPDASTPPSGIRTLLIAAGLFALLVSTEFLFNHTNWLPIPGSLAQKSISPQHRLRDKNHSDLPETLSELVQSPPQPVVDGFSKTDSESPEELRLESSDSLERLGIRSAPVTHREISEFVETNGVIDYDQTRVVKVSSRAPGTVWRVEKQIGEHIRKGDVLAIVEAANVGQAKSDFLQALVQTRFRQATLDRLKKVPEVVTDRQIREAEAALREARIKQVNSQQSLTNLGLHVNFQADPALEERELIRKMQFLGLPDSIISTLDPHATPSSLIPVTAPFDGVVTDRNLSLGEVVDSNRPLFSIADVTRMWIILSVRKEDVDRIRTQQPLTFFHDPSSPGIEGVVQWISPQVDPQSKTVEVRGEVENPLVILGKTSPISLVRPTVRNVSGQSQRRMQANSFGKGKIQVLHRGQATVVPDAALQSLDQRALAFVTGSDPLRFQPRFVRVGVRDGGYTEILHGLQAGEQVVTSGSHALKSELVLRNQRSATP